MNTVTDLQSLLKFNYPSGHIWLDEQRMLLMHARALGALRKELFETLGLKRARGLLVRLGFASGVRDGQMALKHRRPGGSVEEAFMLGPQLHTLEGMVQVEKLSLEINLPTKHFYGEFVWKNSWEDEAHIADYGQGDEPACWTMIGYASGYTSAFMGRLTLFREMECMSQGDSQCMIIGQSAEAWNDPEYEEYFKAQAFAEELIEYHMGAEKLDTALVRRRSNDDLVGVSPAFMNAFELLQRAAQGNITVLLLGETGVGKEMFARWLHDNSPRAKGPFLAVNCAAIPHELIEAELFGVEKGAYTGAHTPRAGRFERADHGTLFLDEVGDLPLSTQVKLLRVLQTGEFERLGSERVQKVNVRIVAATNVELQQAIRDNKFRIDLYYRLNTFPIKIPPLRERQADISPLINRFMTKYCASYNKKLQGLTDKAMQEVMSYEWPGNIRELENLIERAVVLVPDGGYVEACHLFDDRIEPCKEKSQLNAQGELAPVETRPIDELCHEILTKNVGLDTLERRLMQTALKQAKGNLSQAARVLGITRPQLAYRLKKEGIPLE